MANGEIPKTLPFVHREAVKALQGAYPTRMRPPREFRRELREFYRTSYPQLYNARRQDVERAALGDAQLYAGTCFPR